MSTTTDPLPSLELLDFQLFTWLSVDRNGADRDTLLPILETARQLAVDAFMNHYRKADVVEPWLDATGVHILPEIHEALRQYRDLGLFGTSFPEALGGLGLPYSASLAVLSIFAAANTSTFGYAMLTAANARLISTFGTPAQIKQFALPQIEGRWLGTMCLSEPQAGSSLGDIRTRAHFEDEDEFGARYRITGNKMWISGGDQDASENIAHLVLAKIPRADGSLPEGSKGISLFIAPKHLPNGARNEIAVAGLNHKMGNRGTSNCLLNFGEVGGAIGWRVGDEGQGLAQMFMMMNEARISVGTGAAAIGYRGYRHALRYAGERTQGRSVGTVEGAPVLIMAHPDIRRMLLQQKAYAEGALALCFFCASLVDEKTPEAEALLALLTPVAKTWPSEFGLAANDLAIQIHGGYGYTRDFDVEQLWRDNRLNPIHEGTTGIQAVDLLRRKILLAGPNPLERLQQRVAATVARAEQVPELRSKAETLLAFWRRVSEVIDVLRTIDGAPALDDATLFLRAFGHGVVAWLWLDQAVHATPLEHGPLRGGVQYACSFFYQAELPQAVAWLTIVAECSDLPRTIPDSAFS